MTSGDQAPVTVVVVNSLSFTGTTWLNLVLGSHPRCFTLGPPDRAWRLRRDGARDRTCLVHGADCPFWSGFWKTHDADANFFAQLAGHAGRDVVITNNPLADGAGRDLRAADLWVKEIQFVRDGRAIAASHVRHQRGKVSFFEAVAGFLHPSFSTFRWEQDDPDRLCLRYEDVLADPHGALARIAAFTGLDYDESALRFWEHEQHITSGNGGTVALVRLAQGLPMGSFADRQFYEEQFARMREQGPAAFSDARWEEELTRQDRFIFDVLCGAVNARFGYARDRFTLDEIAEFAGRLRRLLQDPTLEPAHRSLLADALRREDLLDAAERKGAIGLRVQLRPGHLRSLGLELTPGQVQRLALALAGAGAGLAAVAMAIGAMACR